MDERIKEHLKRLNEHYLKLIDLRKMSHDDFVNDDINYAAAERWLQIAIESCLNVGNRLISILQFEKSVRSPESYADIFVIMRDLKIIDTVFSQRLVEMARFRNRLVHLYWKLDPEMTYQILQGNLDDLKQFQTAVVEFLNKKAAVQK